MTRNSCGDRVIQFGEVCDDGNTVSRDGCSGTCQIESLPYCGNGALNAGEECDDGNLREGDGCTALCRFEQGICGNGRLETGRGEQCDDGGRASLDGCDANCKLEPTSQCGDGTLQQATEQCDTGNANGAGPSTCRTNCLLPYCGDGILDFNEQCDDGNNYNGDACTALCEQARAAAMQPNAVYGSVTDMRDINSQQPLSGNEYVRRIPSPETTKTGPGLVIFLASGAAAGIGFTRRKFKGRA